LCRYVVQLMLAGVSRIGLLNVTTPIFFKAEQYALFPLSRIQ
jgi:hypothetical protein